MTLFLLVLLIFYDHFLFVFLTTFPPFRLFRARLLVFFIPEYILAHHLFGQSHSLSQIQLSRLAPFTFLLSSSLIFPTLKCNLHLSFPSLSVSGVIHHELNFS